MHICKHDHWIEFVVHVENFHLLSAWKYYNNIHSFRLNSNNNTNCMSTISLRTRNINVIIMFIRWHPAVKNTELLFFWRENILRLQLQLFIYLFIHSFIHSSSFLFFSSLLKIIFIKLISFGILLQNFSGVSTYYLYDVFI